MKEALLDAGYKFNNNLGIWSKSEFQSINYNDGDEVEERISKIIKNAEDISVLSSELRSHCTDWPSLYHLSSLRSNLMRPFIDCLNSADVLEIGAGCGYHEIHGRNGCKCSCTRRKL